MRWIGLGWAAPALVLLLASCFASHPSGGAVSTSPCDEDAPDYSAPLCPEGPGTCVDILYAVDSRGSMVEEQTSLFEQVSRMVHALVTGDLDADGIEDFPAVPDLHLGVVTADLGSGGEMVSSCLSPDRGDDGIVGRGRAGRLHPTCGLELPDFVSWRPGGEPGELSLDAACMLAVGAFGCQYAQPLEAALKALTESSAPPRFHGGSCGHADGANAAFLREDSILMVVVVSDHDDCSVADPLFFADADPDISEAGRFCSRNEELLHPVRRYVEGFEALRRDPADLLFVVVAGVPPRLVSVPGPVDYPVVLGDPDMEIRTDPAEPDRLVPSCDVPGRGVTYPPRRLVRVAMSLDAAGASTAVQSICQADLTSALGLVIDRLP